MPEISTLALFAIAALVLLITPGPAVLYIVARSIHQGRIAGVVSTVGLAVGTLFHVTAAAFGVSALLLSSTIAFNAVKYIGAAYLIYLGVQKLRSRDELEPVHAAKVTTLRQIFYQGILVNLFNPKTALFFFAFLPQFVSPERGAVATQILILGFTFMLLSIITDSLYAVVAGSVGEWLKGNLRYVRAQKYFAGSVYIALGISTAVSGPGKK